MRNLSLVALLTLLAPVAWAGAPALRLVHVNDVHGRLEADGSGDGGAAVFASFVTDQRRRAVAAREPLLLVHAGDVYQGTRLVNATQGQAALAFLARLRFHLGVPGNHEWDYGPEAYQRLAALPRPWVLGTSIAGLGAPTRRRAVVDVEGVKVGFVGYTLPQTGDKAPPGATQGLTFRPGPEALRDEVEGLRARGVKAIVLLSHTDPSDDEGLARGLDLDLVIAGHVGGYQPPRRIEGSRGWYARGGEQLRRAGWLRLELDPVRGRVREVTGASVPLAAQDYPPDPGVARLVHELTEALPKDPAARTVHLDRALPKGPWTGQSPLLAAMAHALREASGADLAVINPGACRARSLGPGTLDADALYRALPYENRVTVLTLRGRDLDQLYEARAAGEFRAFDEDRLQGFRDEGFSIREGRFLYDGRGLLQPSGFTVRLDPSRPPGDRVEVLDPLGEALDPDARFTVATSDYLADGGDGYSQLAALPRQSTHATVREAVVARLADLGAGAAEGPGRLDNVSQLP